jgi:hypothetical protein
MVTDHLVQQYILDSTTSANEIQNQLFKFNEFQPFLGSTMVDICNMQEGFHSTQK